MRQVLDLHVIDFPNTLIHIIQLHTLKKENKIRSVHVLIQQHFHQIAALMLPDLPSYQQAANVRSN